MGEKSSNLVKNLFIEKILARHQWSKQQYTVELHCQNHVAK